MDVYDAISNRRHYKASWPEERVVDELRRGAGRHFDPALVELFLANLTLFRAILAANPDDPRADFRIPELEAEGPEEPA